MSIQALNHLLSPVLSSSPTRSYTSHVSVLHSSLLVDTYETAVTAHPHCLLEFVTQNAAAVSFAWQGLDLSLENESVALNYSFRRDNVLLPLCLFLRS